MKFEGKTTLPYPRSAVDSVFAEEIVAYFERDIRSPNAAWRRRFSRFSFGTRLRIPNLNFISFSIGVRNWSRAFCYFILTFSFSYLTFSDENN